MKHFRIKSSFVVATIPLFYLLFQVPLIEYAKWPDKFEDRYLLFDNADDNLLPIPPGFTFCSEFVPFNDDEVRERFNSELTLLLEHPYSTLEYMNNAQKHVSVVEGILKSYGIPIDFKYMPVIESGYTNVVSHKGAGGYWQLLPSTAQNYGLIVNDQIDKRYDIVKSTKAACKYFNEAYKALGSWTLAAASYNVGVGGLQNVMNKQETESYFNTQFNAETRRFIPKLLAIKALYENKRLYNYKLRAGAKQITSKTITIATEEIDWVQIAKTNGITFKHLVWMNPWIVETFTYNIEKKNFSIKIPTGNTLKELTSELESAQIEPTVIPN